jgi:hypothetical protein
MQHATEYSHKYSAMSMCNRKSAAGHALHGTLLVYLASELHVSLQDVPGADVAEGGAQRDGRHSHQQL